MFIENDRIYFSKDDYIYFKNLRLLRNNRNFCMLRKAKKYPQWSYLLKLELLTENNELKINIDSSRIPLEHYPNIPFVDSKIKNSSIINKRIYLEILKKMFDAVYDSLLLAKEYNLKLYDYVEFFNLNYKGAVVFANNSDKVHLIITNYNCAHNNTHNKRVVLIERVGNDKCYLKIEKNILYYKHYYYRATFHFPNEFEHPIECNDIDFDFDFHHYDEYRIYISKHKYAGICIRSDTPQLLLQTFLEHINMFEKMDELEINSEYDLLKYI